MKRRGYTLVEVMMATALTLMIMYAVVEVFGRIGEGVTNARAMLEMGEELRGAASKIKTDLQSVTVPLAPPRSPGNNEGYLEIIEGPMGVDPTGWYNANKPLGYAQNLDDGVADWSVVDLDDIILFTARSRGEPFVGRFNGNAVQSYDAEIAYFVRGRTLYRRVLLVAPNLREDPRWSSVTPNKFYQNSDISVHGVYDSNGDFQNVIIPNTLGDLTMPENRFAHRPRHSDGKSRYPFHPHVSYNGNNPYPTPWASLWMNFGGGWGCGLGLPTLAECSSEKSPWAAGGPLPTPAGPAQLWRQFDAWKNPHPWSDQSPTTGILKTYHDPDVDLPAQQATRVNEDVLLNNVLSFDIKVWDPDAPIVQGAGGVVLQPGDLGYIALLGGSYTVIGRGAYVDLGYATAINTAFSGDGNLPTFPIPRVYDTWSTHYEEQAGGNGVNGFDDLDMKTGVADGVVDDVGEWMYPPPYAAPIRGIQIKIRVYEPASRQIREVTVVQEYVSK